jgi:FtsP/CotA-like multicopper oxidase with cupredoxin domain
MTNDNEKQKLSRRRFLKMGLGLAGMTAAGTMLPRSLLRPERVVHAAPGVAQGPDDLVLRFVASDGWMYLPGANPPYHPDDMAPEGSPFTTYVFGFRNVTDLTEEQILGQKMKVQQIAPIWWIKEEQQCFLTLGNLGLAVRPDLIDAHTLHFHGFRNAIPIFDGEPHSSVGVPIARELVYYYKPHHPGTYMYHCHFEETEHVHMGMTGTVFVRPLQDGTAYEYPASSGKVFTRFAYNDGDGSTGFDREFVQCLTDVWTLSHWCDSHVQLPEWSDYQPDFYLLNGRVWPDTIEPNGLGPNIESNPNAPGPDYDGDLIAPPGRPDLQYQPVSSLVECEAGESVLLRLVNMAFIEQTMRLGGITMRVVARDATLLRGRDGTDLSYETEGVLIGAGESADAIFVAPPFDLSQAPDGYNRYLLHTRRYSHISNPGNEGQYGGQMTEVRVYPQGYGLPVQTAPNT